MIPEHLINQILDKADIVEVISGYIPLKRAGRNFKAACPFHHEKTPSFMVSPEKQIFHCFGCQKGGNVFGFIMQYERMEFPEAAAMLAEKVGVELPSQPGAAKAASESTKVYSVNEMAANFYHYMLISTDHGKQAQQYLKKRGIKEESIKKLKIGYAPNAWDTLLNYARKKGAGRNELQKAGLVLSGRENTFYDRFRHRIIFPIFSQRGKVVGFGARVLDETHPKYMNSPDTPVYSKSHHLYGMNAAIEHIKAKDFVIVVEGYMDFLMPHQYGIGNIVASLGTALTKEQIRLLKRFTRNIVVVFDSDQAGEAASLKGLDLLLQEDMHTKIVSLPKGYDPDKFIREEGKDKFLEIVSNAPDFFEYKIKLLKSRFDPAKVESKVRIAEDMLQTISMAPNAIVRAEYIKKLAAHLDVRDDVLWPELKKVKRKQKASFRDTDFTPRKQPKMLDVAHRMLLGLVLEEPHLIPKVKDRIMALDIKEDHFKEIFSRICDFTEKDRNMNIAKLLNSLKEEAICNIVSESCASVQNVSDRQKCFQDCMKTIRNLRSRDRLKDLQDMIREAQVNNDEKKTLHLVIEYNKLLKHSRKEEQHNEKAQKNTKKT